MGFTDRIQLATLTHDFVYTLVPQHIRKAIFFPVASKNVSQLQGLRLNHFWFLFLAYIYLPSYMYAHYDIFQSPSGTWNRHAIFYWLESTLGKKLSSRKNMHLHLLFLFPMQSSKESREFSWDFLRLIE